MSNDQKLNILVAYPYMKSNVINILNENQNHIRFLLDSGAFTAWKAGKPINLDDYCRFIETLPFKPWRYFTLDVIGNPEASLKNYEIMLQRGFNPIPIFTRGEDPKMINEYYKTSDVVGIGGLVGTKGNKGFIKGIMNLIGDRKCHWLGFTESNFISYYKPYMCDCSSWSYVCRYGNMFVYNFKGKFDSIYRIEFKVKPKQHIYNNIKKLGFNPEDFNKEINWRGDYCLSKKLNAKSFLLKIKDAKKLFNTNMFLACGSESDIKIILDLHKEI